ncbi:enoyl-CoA hydratase/isomerase family protein [Novosphingobium sp. Fuku2-ISO-50]|uniref:enoyl-CoA hydratase/isomerase family protein n=1 Tax=Novosphingobium sp. Fuku2-ISO-50 TaxID=1739114 RepID=UPI00076C03C6|nr:enoyl-CoA hydratase/isomerase family protein [Novosphingobium sp. Fuku2-ISO-50]KUR73259.1 enoyl-CoA hydratase [Novosphingobium sp. Fuku2-ISO-50]
MAYETIILERPADGVALLTLNRPDRGNGVVPELAADLIHALNALDDDFSVRVLVITGAGKQFCAGADLVEFKRYLENDHARLQEPYNARVLFPVTQRLVSSRLPVIAAINGGATAGGLDLALACDIRIASTAAKLGETYIKLGLNPGNGGTYFLPRLVGSGIAAEMALTGDLFDAERALAVGLVNSIVEPDQLIGEAVALAARIAERPRLAIEATKQQLRQSWHMDLQGSMNASFWGVAAMTYSADLREGVNAALEKRAPQYNRDNR